MIFERIRPLHVEAEFENWTLDMNDALSLASGTRQPPLAISQRRALVSLLADESPAIYAAVRQRLLSMGPAALEPLRPALLDNNPLLRRRARALADEINRETADAEFTVFIINHGENFDLETGIGLLARTQFPQLSRPAYQAVLDAFAADLRPAVNAAPDPRARLEIINHYLFQHCGFRGNESKYYDPNNSYFNKVIDLRTGNPISLTTIYLLVARRLGLPMVGVGLPLHFMCRYQAPTGDLYVDPFHQGRICSKIDVIRRYKDHMLGSMEDHLRPATSRSMLMRMCRNLAQIYLELEMPEAARFRQYVAALQ